MFVRDANYEIVRRLQKATHFKKVIVKEESNKSAYVPCDPDAEGAIKMSLMDIQPEELFVEPLSIVNDLMSKKRLIKPTMNIGTF